LAFIKTQGIILRTLDYSESNLIVHIFTKEYGLITGMVYGAKSTKSKKKNFIWKLGNIVALDLDFKNSNKIQPIKEGAIFYQYKEIPFDIYKNALTTICIEILTKCIKENQANQQLYDFVLEFLTQVDSTKDSIKNYLVYFLLHITAPLGIQPILKQGGTWIDYENGEITTYKSTESLYSHEYLSLAHTYDFFKMEIKQLGAYNLPVSERQELISVFFRYLKTHLPDFSLPKSLQIYKDILY